MPYPEEYAHYRPLQRLVQDERVRQLLPQYRIREALEGSDEPPTFADVTPSQWAPKWILAVDGGYAPVTIQNGFPSAEAAYITVASVLIDAAKVRELDLQRPADPKEFRTTEDASSIDWALPGCNVIYSHEASGRASFRRSLYELFREHRIAPNGESLLETYEALLSYKPADHAQQCPYEDCEEKYVRGTGKYSCRCNRMRPLYSTDALRIHERMQPDGVNGEIYAEILQVLERAWVVHILRMLIREQWLPALTRMAIVLDGPLAVFGQPAWISQAISQELRRINQLVRTVTHDHDLLLLGIEKTGLFATHLTSLDTRLDGHPGVLKNGSLMLITDRYIKRNIAPSESTKPYGKDTYFGRKFFYKTTSGALVVASLPFFDEAHEDLSTAEAWQYPRLSDAISLLEQVVSSRYEHALTPLVAAHAEAAIPLHLGKKILERLARDAMQDGGA
jgi:hypothetical protein